MTHHAVDNLFELSIDRLLTNAVRGLRLLSQSPDPDVADRAVLARTAVAEALRILRGSQ